MEEKKKSSSILTVLCVILIMLAIAVIGVLFYQNNELRKLANNLDESTKNTNVSDSNQNIVNNEQKSISSETKSNSNNEVKFLTREEIIDFIEKVNNKMYCRLQLTSIKKDGEKYLATANYLEQDPLTEEEYKEIVKNGIEVDGYKFIFSNEKFDIYPYARFILDDSSYEKEYDEMGNEIQPWINYYDVEKKEDGYMLSWGVGGLDVYPLEKVKESISFYLDGDTKIIPSYYDEEIKLLKDCVSELTEGYLACLGIAGYSDDNEISLHELF